RRLDKKYNNLKPNGLDRLIADYPSHEFVIDRAEAESLFKRVRSPSDNEGKLGQILEQTIWAALQSRGPATVMCLSLDKTNQKVAGKENDKPGNQSGRVPASPGRAGGGTSSSGESSGEPGGGTRRRRRTVSTASADGLPNGKRTRS